MNAPARYQPLADIDRRPTAASQATAIEQSRAIAEVQSQVIVAQNCPRDMLEAEREMEYVCGRLDMAEQAFYQVTNRGTGPSVHLARELARIWGNIDYGVKELHRDDTKGISEVLAFAWDMQKNSRSSRTFINPHARMKSGNRVELTDLQDIYLSNQNIGARAVRETIFTIIPRWFTEKAMNICRRTLEHGEGEPLQDRLDGLVKWFADKLDVTQAQLEARIEKKRGQWDAADGAQLKIAGTSIARGEAKKDDLFPPAEASSSTADEISRDDEAKPARKAAKKAPARKVSPERKKLDGRMFDLLSDASLSGDKERDNRLIVLTSLAIREEPLTTSADLTDDEVKEIIQTLDEVGGAAERQAVCDNILRQADAAEPNEGTEQPPTEQTGDDNNEGQMKI